MRQFLNSIITFLTLVILTRCSGHELSDKDIETKALRITELLDSNSIQTFYEWNYYGKRGNNEIWIRASSDSNYYKCLYRKDEDTVALSILEPLKFSIDFPSNLSLDLTKYHRYDFYMFNGNIIRLVSFDNYGHDQTKDTLLPVEKVFSINPFDHFASLSAWKNQLGVYRILYNSDKGNMVSFWVSAQHKLTYIPENFNLNSNYQKIWLDELAKGKTLKKGWILRKLEKPLDGG